MGRLTAIFIVALASLSASAEEPLLYVEATPSTILLEPNASRAKIFIAAPKLEATARVRLFTNVGALTDPQPVDGGYSASFIPPEKYFPQVAIVVARVTTKSETLWGWAQVLLAGKGVVEVEASPRASVTLKLAGRRFGPVRASWKGKAQVPVEVPPGYDSAEAGGRKVPVDTPNFLRVLAVPAGDVAADGSGSGGIRIFAVTKRGAPLESGADIHLEASSGDIGAPMPIGPGIFSASYAPPSSATAGGVTTKVSLAGSPGLVNEATINLVAGAPVRIDAVFDPPEVVAGQMGSRLKLSVMDAAGNPAVLDGSGELKGGGGSFGGMRRASEGRYELDYTAPTRVPPSGSVQAEIKIAGLVGKAKLRVSPGPVAKVTIADPGELTADPGNVAALGVVALDAYGNPVAGAALTAEAQSGQVMAVVPLAAGAYSVNYTPPASETPVNDVVVVRSSTGASGERALALGPHRRRFGLGLHAGMMTNFAALTVPSATLDFSYRLEGLGMGALDGLAFGIELGAQHRYVEREVTSGPLAGQAFQSYLTAVPVGLTARYHLRFLQDFTGYVGLGPDVAYLNSVVLGTSTSAEGLFGWGGHGSLGLTYRVGRGAFVVDLRYMQLFTDAIATVDGAPSGLGLTVGYRVELF